MHNSTLARRYAVALGQLAQEKGALHQIEADLASISSLCASGELMALLTDEKTSRESKEAALRQLFTGRAHPLTLNFLLLVVHKARVKYLPAMAVELQRYADEARGVVAVSVTTAVPLDARLRDSLRGCLIKVAGRDVRLVEATDPQILGGIKVQIGDKVIDGSVQGRVRRLKNNLKAVQFSRENG